MLRLKALHIAGEAIYNVWSELSGWRAKDTLEELYLYDVQLGFGYRILQLLCSVLPRLKVFSYDRSSDQIYRPQPLPTLNSEQLKTIHKLFSSSSGDHGCDNIRKLVIRESGRIDLSLLTWQALYNLVSLTLKIPTSYLSPVSEGLAFMSVSLQELNLTLVGE